MDKANTLNQMEQYDFNTPINVTMIFEDSDDEMSSKNVLREQIVNNDNKQEKKSKNIEFKKGSETETKLVDCHDILLNVRDNTLVENPAFTLNSNTANKKIEVEQSQFILDNTIHQASEHSNHAIPKIQQRVNDTEKLDTRIQSLNIVSEHLIMIIKSYYSLYNQRLHMNPVTYADLTGRLTKHKAHLYDLSYSIVVSLILPQEQNELFITKFLNKTAVDANKVLSWRCERKHVEPFFNEMIIWVKHKRKHIRLFGLKDSLKKKNNDQLINKYRILREHLQDTPRAYHDAHAKNTCQQLDTQTRIPTGAYNSVSYDQVMNTENNVCIYSSGDPGREISININPQILINQRQQQDLTATQINGNSDIHSRNVPLAQLQEHRDQHHRQAPQRPPPFYDPNHYVMTGKLPPNLGNMSQIQKNIALSKQNYQIQKNCNTLSSSEYNDNKEQMYHRSIGDHSNISSLLTKYQIPSTTGRCCICNQITTSRCSKCNNISYCSSLCQELDAGTHRTTCRPAS